ncbi:M48 family metallopeptidase [Nocardioides sp. BE266]|uniref:M48 family metallopeptidase n=1 Tax=Nocardioides sp. BE266 TaxID=2817725 RepID=UPI00286B3753|nr:M48 family metallopeptidase [Nocardioides sp. BE266]
MLARLRAGLAVVMLAGVFVLAALVLGGLLAAVAWIFASGLPGGVLVGAVLAAVALVLVVALTRVFRTTPVAPDGVEVSPVGQPDLWRLVREAAGGVGTPEPDEVRLVAEANAGVTESSRLLGLVPGARVLYIGVPLLQTLTRSELLWVLGHEMGHYSERHTALTGVTRRGLVALDEVVAGLGPRHALGWVFRSYRSGYTRVLHALWRHQELEADRWAATLAGSSNGVSAMRAVASSSSTWSTYVHEYATVGASVGMVPRGLFSGYAEFLSDPARSDLDVDRLIAEEPHSPFDTHPPTAKRIERLHEWGREAHTDSGVVPDDEPALLVLSDAPAVTERVEEHLAREESLTRVAWERAVLFGNRRRDEERALVVMSAVDTLTDGASDLSQALHLVAQGRGRELAELLADGRTLDDEAVAELVRESLEVLVRTALVSAGHASYVLRWDRPDVIVDEADLEVDVAGLVAAVPDNPSMSDWLLEVLREEGISRTWYPSISSAVLGPAGPEVLAVLVMKPTWRWTTPVVHVTEAGLAVRQLTYREQLAIPPLRPRKTPAQLLVHSMRRTGLQLLADPDTEVVPWSEVEQVTYVDGRRPRLSVRRGGRRTSYRPVAVVGDPRQACARFTYGRDSLG